jgi:NADH-quinone oxidoreductase subunit J
LALLFLIVYVGAIAVLFLFVIMMLDLKSSLVNDTSNYHYLVVGTVISLSFYLLIVGTLDFLYESNNYESLTWFRNFHENLCLEDEISEIASLGQVMYTQYVLQFLIAGLILTLAVIGVAVLTVNVSSNSGSQINSNKCL